MKNMLLILFVLSLGHFAGASDSNHIGAFAGAGYSAVDVSNDGTASVSREPGTAFGASISAPIGAPDLEIGVIREQDNLHIPLMIRIGTEKLLTAGLGVFGETGIGNNNNRNFVFGWHATAGLNFLLGERIRAFAEGRYLQDFDNQTDDGGLLALAGMRFALQ